MKAPSTPRARVVAKSKTKAKKKGKTYTAAQQAQYAWLKAHYPFPKSKSSKGKTSIGASATVVQKRIGATGTSIGASVSVKVAGPARTLSLNHPHKIAAEEPVKLGRNAPTGKPALEIGNYMTGAGVPAVVDFASQVKSWPMYGNDTIGDCTAACVGHQIQAWTRYTGAEVTVPQEDIIELYSAVSGYDPKTGANDNGAAIQDVLTYWRKSGVPVAGHKILAFARLGDLSRIKEALWIFGSVYLGINFPESATAQFGDGVPWTVWPGSPIEGGHAIPLQYAGTGSVPYQVVTWGQLQGMDQGFLDTYCDEAWVIVTDDWLEKNGHTPEGLNLQQLGADVAALTGDPNPFPAPNPAPPAPKTEPSIVQEVKQAAETIIQDIKKMA